MRSTSAQLLNEHVHFTMRISRLNLVMSSSLVEDGLRAIRFFSRKVGVACGLLST